MRKKKPRGEKFSSLFGFEEIYFSFGWIIRPWFFKSSNLVRHALVWILQYYIILSLNKKHVTSFMCTNLIFPSKKTERKD